jgi:hypothetical protein
MQRIYCECCCNFNKGKSSTSFVVKTETGITLAGEKRYFKANSEYEGFIKILNRMLIGLEKQLNDYFSSSYITIMLKNEEVINDLRNKKKREDLNSGLKGLFIFVYDTIKKKGVELVNEFDKYSFNDKVINRVDLNDGYRFYELVDKMYLIIKRQTNLYKECSNELSRCDLAIQDILHFIELADIDDNKKADFIDAIKKVRARRRYYKDEMGLIIYFAQTFSSMRKILDNIKMNTEQEELTVDYLKFKPMFSTKNSREETLKNL